MQDLLHAPIFNDRLKISNTAMNITRISKEGASQVWSEESIMKGVRGGGRRNGMVATGVAGAECGRAMRGWRASTRNRESGELKTLW